MIKKLALVTATLCAFAAPLAHAEPTAAKKELIERLMAQQQPAIDNIARNVVEQQPAQMANAARQVIGKSVPEDKQDATWQAINGEIKKYLDVAGPAVQASAKKLATSSMTPLLDEKFTEDELRNLVKSLESPELKKFQTLLPELSDKLLDKVIADARPSVDPALNQMAANVRKILNNASAGGKTAPATKPAAKK